MWLIPFLGTRSCRGAWLVLGLWLGGVCFGGGECGGGDLYLGAWWEEEEAYSSCWVAVWVDLGLMGGVCAVFGIGAVLDVLGGGLGRFGWFGCFLDWGAPIGRE